MTLTHSPDVSAAGWLTAHALPADQRITFGPAGFAAYARLRFLPDPAFDGQSENDVDFEGDADSPSETDQLRSLLDVMADHTTTPDDCYFCLWDGWASDIYGGDITRIVDERTRTLRKGPRVPPAFPRAVLAGPKVRLPHRDYFLFRGGLTDFGDWGAADRAPGVPLIGMPNPAFIWPADRAWCVANDVDPHWAGIGASAEAITSILAHPRLDVVTADPTEEPPTYY